MHLEIGDIAMKTAITAGVMKFLRDYLETAVRMPEWDQYLKYAWVAAIPLLGLGQILSLDFISDKYYYLILFIIVYAVYKSKDFRSARLLLIATIPILAFSILDDIISSIAPDFHQSFNAVFESIKGFTICWTIGFGIYALRQNKRERLQRNKEAEERKALEAKRFELENQVAERTFELTKQKEELELTLLQLNATQSQLIQSEKLASLGELTAGIAHEIQNPLNFVNNFAELSVELAKELKDELKNPEKDWGLIEELTNDLIQNQDKINHHGKRASNIVKNMLEHSRTSTGIKEPIDINALADEYLRLSYHGLRAKDKGFNATMITNFQESLPQITVIPQDIGRVLLNLFNNAFYAVNKRNQQPTQKLEASSVGAISPIENYTPSVFVSTKQIKKTIEIRVKDNGTGMPENVKNKIFQPFFTTKPTGEGTGLGLSLSYDIVTKGHGGTLKVETKEGEFTEFIITLPYL
jgi:two-component system, NtrC family, sensor kinase